MLLLELMSLEVIPQRVMDIVEEESQKFGGNETTKSTHKEVGNGKSKIWNGVAKRSSGFSGLWSGK